MSIEYQIQGNHTTGLTAKHYHGEAISTLNDFARNNLPPHAVVTDIKVHFRGKLSTGDTKFYIGFTNDSAEEPGHKILSDELKTSANTWTPSLPRSGITISSSGYSRLNVWMSSGIIMKKFTCEYFKVVWEYYIPIYYITMGTAEGGVAYAYPDGSQYPAIGTISLTAGSSMLIQAISNEGYSFVKWDDGNTERVRTITANGDKTYTPIFERDKVTVTFKNEDEVLQSYQIYYGETPAYTGSTPIKNSTPQYHYTFKCWNFTFGPIYTDMVYEAVFTETLREYQVNAICVRTESGDTVKMVGSGVYKYGNRLDLRPEGIPPYHELDYWMVEVNGVPKYFTSTYIGEILDENIVGDGSKDTIDFYCYFKHTGYNIKVNILPDSNSGTVEYGKIISNTDGTKTFEKIENIPNGGSVNIKYSERKGFYGFKAIPNEKYKFVKWVRFDEESTENPKELSINQSLNYTAVFDLDRINQIIVDLSQSESVLVDLEESSEILVDNEKVYG